MSDWIGGFAKLAKAYPKAEPAMEFRERLRDLAAEDSEAWAPLFDKNVTPQAIADYLFDQLVHPGRKTVGQLSRRRTLFDAFCDSIPAGGPRKVACRGLKSADSDPARFHTCWHEIGRMRFWNRTHAEHED